MEFLIGSLATMLAGYIFLNKIKDLPKNDIKFGDIKYSQSHIFNLIKDLLPSNKDIKAMLPKNTQSVLHNKNQYLDIIILENKAYWIKDSNFYYADVIDGNIQKETTKQVDTISMDRVELDKMIFIVDKLTKGKGNEDSDTRNS